jgi:hypothetical protein
MICGAEACKLGAMIHGAELRVHFLKSFQLLVKIFAEACKLGAMELRVHFLKSFQLLVKIFRKKGL